MLLFAVLLFLAHEVEARVIFDTVAYPGKIIRPDGFEFVIHGTNEDDVAVLTYISQDGNKTFILEENETEVTDGFSFTYMGRDFDLDNNIGRIDPETFNKLPEYRLRIESTMPSLSADIYVEQGDKRSKLNKANNNRKISMFEEVNITYIIRNVGDNAAEDVEFIHEFPDSFKVQALDNSSLELVREDSMQRLYWQGDIDEKDGEKDKFVFKFSVRPMNRSDTTISPRISYNFMEERYFFLPVPLHINYTAGITWSTTLDKDRSRLGQVTSYEVYIRNDEDVEKEVSLNIDFPYGQLIRYLGANFSGGEKEYASKEGQLDDFQAQKSADSNEAYNKNISFSWKDSIHANENVVFRFRINQTGSMNGIIKTNLSLMKEGFSTSYHETRKMISLYFKPIFNIFFNTSEITPYKNMNLVVLMQNRGNPKDFEDLYVFIESNFMETMEMNQDELSLKTDEKFHAFNIIYQPEELGENQTPYVFVRGFYETPFGEKIVISKNQTILKRDVSNTNRFIQGQYDRIFKEPVERTWLQNMTRRINGNLSVFMSKVTGARPESEENILLIPILILVAILAVNIMRNWNLDVVKDSYRGVFSDIKDSIRRKLKGDKREDKLKKFKK